MVGREQAEEGLFSRPSAVLGADMMCSRVSIGRALGLTLGGILAFQGLLCLLVVPDGHTTIPGPALRARAPMDVVTSTHVTPHSASTNSGALDADTSARLAEELTSRVQAQYERIKRMVKHAPSPTNRPPAVV